MVTKMDFRNLDYEGHTVLTDWKLQVLGKEDRNELIDKPIKMKNEVVAKELKYM